MRTNLLAQCNGQRFCYLITSAEAGEGKSVSSLNLAMIMAERSDRRTVVVDCDLRKKKIAKLLGIEDSVGMAELLRGTHKVKDVVQPTAYPAMSVISAGAVRQDEVADLIGRPELEDVVSELRKRYDYVIVDSPPVNIAADAGALGHVIGEALVVLRMYKTRRESAQKAIRLLHAANTTTVGVILTHQKYYIPNYLYRYS